MQRNNREFELIVQNSILNCVRDFNIPVNDILKCYLEEQEDSIEDVIPSNNRVKDEENKDSIQNKMKTMLDEQKKIEKKENINELSSISMDEGNSSGSLEILNDESETNEEEVKNTSGKEFKLKTEIIETSTPTSSLEIKSEPPKLTKSLSFSDTVQAVDITGGIEDIPMSVIDERRQQREDDLFYGGDDEDDDPKLKIGSDSNLELEFETLN